MWWRPTVMAAMALEVKPSPRDAKDVVVGVDAVVY